MGRLDAAGETVEGMKHSFAIALLACLLFGPLAGGHVGSPDVYYEGTAGPYRLFVTIRTPPMIPGIAQIEVRTLDGGPIDDIRVVALRVIGEGSQNAPPPDHMERSKADAQFFTGKLWLMESGSWQVRIDVSGPRGPAEIAVPVPAFAQRSLRMQETTGGILSALMALLVLSFIAISGAAARESQLEPGANVPPAKRTRGRMVMGAAAVGVLAIVFLGNAWWNDLASANSSNMVYKAPPMNASIVPGGELVLKMGASPWHEQRKRMQLNKIIADHGHLMHLFLIRMPEMDAFYHLHPDEGNDGTFTKSLPTMTGGSYVMFADIVRESGFPDTMTAKIEVTGRDPGAVLTGDDSAANPTPVSKAQVSSEARLGDDEHVEWLSDGQSLRAQQSTLLRFRVVHRGGEAATDLEPYMGMAGHLVIVRRDLAVFAHVHPAGSVPMAALMLLQKGPSDGEHSMAAMQGDHEPAEFTFPYGFPQAGDYRLFLQVKRAGHVETAVFDTHVAP